MISPDDILYTVKTLSRLGRHDDAIAMFDHFLEVKTELTKDERTIFFVVYKYGIDASRQSQRSINLYYTQNQEEGNTERADLLDKYRNLVADKIIHNAQKAIDIIDNVLLDSASDPAALGYYYKMKGDMYRYIAETSEIIEKDKGTENGKKAYLDAIQICNENLSPVDATRLGAILNAAVFRYEHLHERTEAIGMLQDAINDIKNNSSEIDQESSQEVNTAYNTMVTNLKIWSAQEEEEDEGDAQ